MSTRENIRLIARTSYLAEDERTGCSTLFVLFAAVKFCVDVANAFMQMILKWEHLQIA